MCQASLHGLRIRPAFRRPRGGALELRILMQDIAMLFFTAVFFAVAFLYIKACQKLR